MFVTSVKSFLLCLLVMDFGVKHAKSKFEDDHHNKWTKAAQRKLDKVLISSNGLGTVDPGLNNGPGVGGVDGTELEQHLVDGKLVGGLPGGVGSGLPGGSGGRGSGRGSGKGSGLMKTGLKSGGKGGGGEINYVSSANPELRLLDFDEDYDFNLPPPSMKKGPVPVNVSINLRNILQVKICV